MSEKSNKLINYDKTITVSVTIPANSYINYTPTVSDLGLTGYTAICITGVVASSPNVSPSWYGKELISFRNLTNSQITLSGVVLGILYVKND